MGLIGDVRSALGLSQLDFARALGVTMTTVYRWESGSEPSGPPAALLKAIRTVIKRGADLGKLRRVLAQGPGQVFYSALRVALIQEDTVPSVGIPSPPGSAQGDSQ